MISKKDAAYIANYFYEIDQVCRVDLNENLLVSERDYVSRFTTLAMYPTGYKKGRTSAFISQTLPGIYEQKFGCDGILIFKKGNNVKVGMFEAKWPRMRSAKYYGTKDVTAWDNVVKTTEISRFSSELKRQSKISKDIVIWEMFFNDSVPPSNSPFDAKGSACVLREVANRYVINTRKDSSKAWNKKDLIGLLKHNSSFVKKPKPKNIEDILFKMLTCEIGKKIRVASNSFKLIFETDHKELISDKYVALLKELNDSDSGIVNLVSPEFKSDMYLIQFLSEPGNVSKLPYEVFNKIRINMVYDVNLTGSNTKEEFTNEFEVVAKYFQKQLESYSPDSEDLYVPVVAAVPLPVDSEEQHSKETLHNEIRDRENQQSEEPESLHSEIRAFMKKYGITHYYFIDLDKVNCPD